MKPLYIAILGAILLTFSIFASIYVIHFVEWHYFTNHQIDFCLIQEPFGDEGVEDLITKKIILSRRIS